MIYEVNQTEQVSFLFDNWEETLIWSCLQGIMGKVYADHPYHPTSAMAILGDFSFFAGRPNKELISYQPAWCKQNFRIMVPQNQQWEKAILQIYKKTSHLTSRYATKKEPSVFNKKKLKEAVLSLTDDYEIRPINEELYHMCQADTWSSDLVSQFSDYKTYCKLGLGIVALKNHQIVSGASSYARYRDGIEIEIDTKEEYRRKGLALACGAKLILACLEQNLYPSWDAHNLGSFALATKLGYHYSHTYTAVEIWG